MASIFTNPKQLAADVGRNLLINGVDIYHHIETGTTAQANGWYQAAGKNFGEAASLLLWGGEEHLLQLI